MRKLRSAIAFLLGSVLLIWIVLSIFLVALQVDEPQVQGEEVTVSADSTGLRFANGCWYVQNGKGLWEAYIEGEPYQRGLTFGKLASEQVVSQEVSFVSQIRKLIPSEWFLNSLKYGVVFFNRDLPDHVSLEMQQEIYGVSQSFSDEYNFIGKKYDRILNYHAAHDIGHALQDLSIVGCTSFAAWDASTTDSSLIIGRNFDFYMGDDFAKDKIILFVNPDSGYAFASITWAGMMGVVSGMNEEGLTVTLNAAKSSIPSGAKTPISILAREILQYAKNIDQAYAIAASRETFVSESILIGSANDGHAAVIEKSPDRLDIYRTTKDHLMCGNHYQSDSFKNDPINLKNIADSDSKYRFDRTEQLLSERFPLDVQDAVSVLRSQKGLNDVELGMGNPKAINQLLAHHAVIFQPEKRLMWVSTKPFQLGEFLCYDLRKVFSIGPSVIADPLMRGLYIDSLTLPADPFLFSEDFEQFLRYKELKNQLFEEIALGKPLHWTAEMEEEFIHSNPESYVTYLMLGDHYFERDELQKAKQFYEMALSKEVASEQERRKIMNSLDECK